MATASKWKPWHEVVQLRDELKTGELSLSMFAADLDELVEVLGLEFVDVHSGIPKTAMGELIGLRRGGVRGHAGRRRPTLEVAPESAAMGRPTYGIWGCIDHITRERAVKTARNPALQRAGLIAAAA